MNIKSKNQIFIASLEQEKILKDCGKYLNEILQNLKEFTKSGISTYEIDVYAQELFKKSKVKPSFLGLYGYPATICTSVNEECVHGIPSKEKILKEGDLLTIDIGGELNGLFTDMAYTLIVDNKAKSIEDINLVEKTKEILYKQIDYIKPGLNTGDLAKYTEDLVNKFGYKVIINLGGHGIGNCAHCEPFIANHSASNSKNTTFVENMVIALEPIISIKDTIGITPKGQNWVVISKNKSNVAHFEHTIIIKKEKNIILTE